MVLLCVCLSNPLASRAQTPYSADTIKAAFLYRFAGYVEWPGAVPDRSVFTIAVLGQSNVASELERLLQNQPIKGRPAVLRRIRDLRGLGDAQILFIAPVYENPRPVIAQLGSRPVLVVTDHERGLELGSMLNFVMAERRVRFEASLEAAERAELRISSELLAVAARVRGGRKREL
jgi:hypothetical protein